MARRIYTAVVIAVSVVLGFAGSAHALFHLAVIDEVLTSYGGDSTKQFIEIRMLASSQNFVANSVLAAFDVTGAYVGDILVLPSNVPNSGSGVRWLVETANFQATFPGIAPDFVMPAGILPTGGGMLCFGGGGGILPQNPPTWNRSVFSNYVDCVAYGTYAGPANPIIGTPTTLDGDGHSLQRSGMTNNNLADFICGNPMTPENNAGAFAGIGATAPCPAPTATVTPSATPTVTPTPPGCPASPDGTCLNSFAKGLLLVSEAPGKQKFLAKFIGGPATVQTDLGNPLTGGGTAYHVCVYDTGGALAGQLDVDRAGATCGSAACWKAVGGDPPGGKGYKYKDAAATADGVTHILSASGAAGKTKALVKGAGSNLPSGITAALQSSGNATMQLRGSDAPKCLSVALLQVRKHDPTLFKANR